jgi:ATP-dependent DNA ligase
MTVPRHCEDSPGRWPTAISDGMLALRDRTDGFVAPCIPSLAPQAAGRTEWIHEIKHDVYRLIVCAGTARPWDHDWTDRYPAIAAAAPPFRDECLPGFVPA